MNILRAEEMDNLESILSSNSDLKSSDFKYLKKFEITYLLRAKKLPYDDFSSLIEFYQKNNLDNRLLINALIRKYNISEKEAKERLKEVKRIMKFKSNEKTLMLKQTI